MWAEGSQAAEEHADPRKKKKKKMNWALIWRGAVLQCFPKEISVHLFPVADPLGAC